MTIEVEHAEATERLASLCRSTGGKPDPSVVLDLVKHGANFLVQCPREFIPILHHFVFHGMKECVAACLSRSAAIDFTITNNKWEMTVFHCIGEQNGSEEAASILQMLIDRLMTHPEDLVDWEQRDLKDDNFLSHVARHQKLSILWPIVKQIPYFQREAQLPIHQVWEHDWEALGEQQHCFVIEGNMICANAGTRRLAHICKWSSEKIEPSEVIRCVLELDGDVCFWDPNMFRPLLHELIWSGRLECVAACLQTPRPINFTTRDEFGWPPHFFVCPKRITEESAASIVRMIVNRIERRPDDTVDWGQTSNDGYDFISCAAKHQKLSCLWPVVLHMPYYADRMEPLHLTKGVWKYDWDNLGSDQMFFVVDPNNIIQAERCTAQLVRECELNEWKPSGDVVKRWACEGADISFTDPGMNKPLLHHFIVNEMVDCVEACFFTEKPIDFTISAECGWTPLHYLSAHTSASTAKGILSLILARLERCQGDTINWEQKDEDGNDFISYAGYYQKLSTLWPLLKKSTITVFKRGPQNPLHLSLPVNPDDWFQLGEDQSNFILDNGFLKSTNREEAQLALL